LMAFGWVTRELFVVKLALEDSAILKDDSGTNDRGISVEWVGRTIDPVVFGHVGETRDDIWVLLVIETVPDLERKSLVVEDIGRGSGS
jgi:hypothetical protein